MASNGALDDVGEAMDELVVLPDAMGGAGTRESMYARGIERQPAWLRV
jgi:hypothetical protein